MSDQLECSRIMKMTDRELLDYVMSHPDYLTDSYFSVFKKAILKRHEQLVKQS